MYEGTLYVQTTGAMIHAFDAETGQTLWARQVGRPQHPSLMPAAYRDLLAAVNGSRLYLVNRYNGDVLYETEVQGAPSGGPALDSKRCYVSTLDGLVLAFRIEPLTDPLQELGKIHSGPLTAEEKKALEEERRPEHPPLPGGRADGRPVVGPDLHPAHRHLPEPRGRSTAPGAPIRDL